MTLKELFTVDNILKVIKFFKPEFYNKITWLVVGSGLALLAGKPLLEIILSAYLEKYFAMSITNDYDSLIGLTLVFMGLFYNVITVYLDKNLLQKKDTTDNKYLLKKDTQLFKKLLETLPSDGNMRFLREHSFFDSFELGSIKQVINFYDYWNNAEYEFINEELETLRKRLYQNIQDFVGVSSTGTYSQSGGWFSAIPDRYQGEEENLPIHVVEKIKKMNDLAEQVYQSHQELIRRAKQVLSIVD